MSQKEQRRHRRVNMDCVVEVRHPSFGSKMVRAKDFSDSGLYILLKPDEIPPIDTIVEGQVQGLNGEAPCLKMKVVRIDQGGIGLHFVNPDDIEKLH